MDVGLLMSEMNNMPFPRYCCWSIIQVFAVVAFYRNGVSGERAQDCVGSRLSLRCPEMKVINISVVVLGDSGCRGTSCCIKDNDCTRNANANHVTDVQNRCNGQRSCTVNVIKEWITCGYLNLPSNNDFERITYNCINDPQKVSTSRTDVAHSTLDITTQSSTTELANDDARYTTSVNNEQFAEPEQHQNDGVWLGENFTTFMVITIIVIFIVIVIVLVKLRRKTKLKWRQNGTELSLMRNTRNETTEENENQETSLHQNNNSTSPTSRFNNDTAPEIKTSKGSKAKNCESSYNKTLNNAVPNKLRKEKQKEGAYCKKDVMETVHSSPKVEARAYSPAQDLKESQCTWASEELDSNVYWELESEIVTNLQRRNSEEVWNEYDYVALTRQTGLEVDTPFNTALEVAATPALKKDFPAKVEEQNEVITSKGSDSPIYETVPPGTPETNRVSEEATLPNWSLATRTISEEDSETGKDTQRENPYCDMRWSHLRVTEDEEFEDSTHTGSSKDDNICCNGETREPVETGCTTLNYIELDCTRRESNGATNEDTMDIPTQKPEQDVHNTFNVASGLKVGSAEKGEGKGEVDVELWENALYLGLQCDGQSSEEWVTSGDGQTVIDNDIYSH